MPLPRKNQVKTKLKKNSPNKSQAREKIFSDSDCQELYKIIKKFTHIVDCKILGEYKLEEKQAAWNEISTEFNSITLQVKC